MLKKEHILQRLHVLIALPEVRGDEVESEHVYRNRAQLQETEEITEVPAFVLMDGDHVKVGPTTRSGGGRAPQLMLMTPQIFFVPKTTDTISNINEDDVNVGTVLSDVEERLVKAVMQDGELENLLGENGYIEYRGVITDLQSGGEAQGQLRMDFALVYMFNPNKL